MINLASSISIHRPLKEVFEFISSSENDLQWQHGTLASGPVSQGAAKVGAFFRTIGHLVGRRMDSTFEVTEHAANRRYGFKSLSGPLQSSTVYSLVAVGGATNISVSTEAKPGSALPVPERDLQKYMQAQLKEDLALLKSIMETR